MTEQQPPTDTLLLEPAAPELTPFQKRRMLAEYKKLLSLIPNGKHKNQRKSAAENKACFKKGKKRLR